MFFQPSLVHLPGEYWSGFDHDCSIMHQSLLTTGKEYGLVIGGVHVLPWGGWVRVASKLPQGVPGVTWNQPSPTLPKLPQGVPGKQGVVRQIIM